MKWALIGLGVAGIGAIVAGGLIAGTSGAVFMAFVAVVIAICGGINFILVGQGAGKASRTKAQGPGQTPPRE